MKISNRLSILLFFFTTLGLSTVNFNIDEIFPIDASNAQAFSDRVRLVTYFNGFFVTVYGGLLWLLNRTYESSTQLKWADSIYYLGFILTLVALITAFSNVESGKDENLIKATIVQNAIALASTVWAIFLRTLWKLSIPIQRDELNYVTELTFQYEILKDTISSTTTTFETETEKFSSISEKLSGAFESIQKQFESELKTLGTSFENYRTQIAENIDAQRVSNEALRKSTAEFEKIANAMAKFENALDAIENALRNIEADGSYLSNLAKELQNAIDAWKTEADDISKSIVSFSDNFSKSDRRNQQFQETLITDLNNLVDRFKAVDDNVSSLQADLREISNDDNLKNDANRIRLVMDNFEARVERFAKNYSRVDGPANIKEYTTNLLKAFVGRF